MQEISKLQILKFGGTSVKDLESINSCCHKIKLHAEIGPVIVIVSAKAGATNLLLDNINVYKKQGIRFCQKEIDMIITTGENISAGLVSAVLNSNEIKSVPMSAWQIPIKTIRGEINSVSTDIIYDMIEQGIIPVITGFQGVEDNAITSLDRGGSDITAVRIAEAMNAKECYIYTDMPGIWRVTPFLLGPDKNQILSNINYEDAYDLALNGARIIHKDSVEVAAKTSMKLYILSTFETQGGTCISDAQQKQHGIACKESEPDLVYVMHNSLVELNPRLNILNQDHKAAWIKLDFKINDINEIYFDKFRTLA